MSLSDKLLEEFISEQRRTRERVDNVGKEVAVLNENIMGVNGLQKQMNDHKEETKKMFANQNERLEVIEKRVGWRFYGWLVGTGAGGSGLGAIIAKNFPLIAKFITTIGAALGASQNHIP